MNKKTKQILIIHPEDPSTSFLQEIKNYLIHKFKNNIEYVRINPNDTSHLNCINKIKQHPENSLVIFMGHGKSDKLYGSRGKLFESRNFESESAVEENPELFYNKDNFINKENVSVFAGKKVFCLACNSNAEIAKFAIEYGAKSFFSFGDIPTSKEEFKDYKESINNLENFDDEHKIEYEDFAKQKEELDKKYNYIVKYLKNEFVYIIKKSLEFSLLSSFNFEQLENTIHFITNQRISDLLINKKILAERYEIADYLYFFKKEIVVYGDKKLKLASFK